MSLSRTRPIVGLQPRIFASLPPTSARFALVARRLLSSSTCSRSQYTSPDKESGLTSGIASRVHHAEELPREFDKHGNEINPYADGPSALDKAVHLFFFTEIIRGTRQALHIIAIANSCISSRNVDCDGELLPTALHNHVSV